MTRKKTSKRVSHRGGKTKRQVTKRRRSKRGGAEPGAWDFNSMGPNAFLDTRETTLPTGPPTECQSLECKKAKAQKAVEVAMAALEQVTIELQDAREREQMQQLLVPLQRVAAQLNTMVSTGATSTSQMLGDVANSASRMGQAGVRRSLKNARDLGVRAAHLGARGIGSVARHRKKNLAPGSKQALAYQSMIDSSNRFTGINP